MGSSVLIVYYSLTNQTAMVIHNIAAVLHKRGYKTDIHRIRPIDDWCLPLTKAAFARQALQTFAGLPLRCAIEEMHLNRLDYEHVILGWQPWFLRPSIPVESFLKSTMGRVVRGRKVWLVGTCRSMWSLAQEILTIRIERLGGKVMGGMMVGGELQSAANLISYGYYILNAGDVPESHWIRRLEPNWKGFGIGEGGILKGLHYGHFLAESLDGKHPEGPPTWVRVNV